jgi:hypothetical protein
MIQQPAPPPTPPIDAIVFHYDHPGMPVPRFTLTITADGTAVYQASYAPDVPKYSPYAEAIRAQPLTDVSTTVTLAPASTAALFTRMVEAKAFPSACASKAKNIASTGVKTLTYHAASCTYDYADDKLIASITAALQGIAFTLDTGRTITRQHRYDRLALDHTTEYLAESARDGTAADLEIIAPILRSLVDDPQVLERVRTRAANLLAHFVPSQ